MSTCYEFMVEAKYNGVWHNVDFYSVGWNGRIRHQFLASVSRGNLGLLEKPVHAAAHMTFEELSESTQEILLNRELPQYEDAVKLDHYFLLGNLEVLEKLVASPYQHESYVTRNQTARFENGDIEELEDGLTAQEFLKLPEETRREYVLYKWDNPHGSRDTVKYMLKKVREQLEMFNDSIPYRCGMSADELNASAVRIIYRLS